MHHDGTKREISIAELERELADEEAFDEVEAADTEEMPAVAVSDFEDQPTGVYEIGPSSLARWAHGSAQVYWVALVP